MKSILKEESVIGKTYIPHDNSYLYCLTYGVEGCAKKLQDLLINAAAEIVGKKIEDNRIELFYLPKKMINQLESSGCIERYLADSEMYPNFIGVITAEGCSIINHAKIMAHPYDDMIIFKRYCNKFPEAIKIEISD